MGRDHHKKSPRTKQHSIYPLFYNITKYISVTQRCAETQLISVDLDH